MKQLLLTMLLAMPCFLKAQNYPDKGIRWSQELTWNEIKRKAKEENKFIFVDCYATWCGPCKRMDNEVYTDEKVGEQINSKFLSVKVQMDKTSNDNESVKAWYPVVELLNEYGIGGYPSFLFFSPDGKFVYKDIGYKDVEKFIAVAKEALTDPNARYDKAIEKFKDGQLPYTQMPELARDVFYKKKDEAMGKAIAKKYKTEYADKLGNDSAYTRDNLYFLAEFYTEIDLSSKDRYFKFFYKNPQLADSIINCIRGGNPFKMVPNIIRATIRKEEITQKLYKDGAPIGVNPNWEKIGKNISRKFHLFDATMLLLDEKIDYYQATKNWQLHIKYVVEKVEKYGKDQVFKYGSNNIVASFIHCDDSLLLGKAISWVAAYMSDDLLSEQWQTVVKKSKDTLLMSGNNDFSNYACLLYKAGRKKEAIKWVELHIRLMEIENKAKPGTNSVSLINKRKVLEKMTNGESIDDLPVKWFF